MHMRTASAVVFLFAVVPLLCAQQGQIKPPGLPEPSPPGKLPALPGVPLVTPSAPATPATPATSPPTAPRADLVTFDPNSVQVRWVNSHWQLQAGNIMLKDFGSRESDAREALNLIRKLHLTQRGTVGRPVPIMEYWLANGKAPVTLTSGLRVSPIDLTSVRAESIQDSWYVRDDKRILFNFGPLEQDARQAADVIRQHGFTQIGHVGGSKPAMIYFLGGKSGFGNSMIHPASIAPAPIPRSDSQVSQASATSTTGNSGPNKDFPNLTPAMLHQASLMARGMHQLAAPPTGNVTQIRLDSGQIALRQDGPDWKLYHGQHVVADFGPHKSYAAKALNILKHYGCDEQYLIGHPLPTFSYFLTKGHAPLGVRFDLQGRLFQPDRVAVRQIQQSWYVCDGDRPLLFFGNRREDANQVAQAIKRYRFDFISQIGPADQPAMSILVRSR